MSTESYEFTPEYGTVVALNEIDDILAHTYERVSGTEIGSGNFIIGGRNLSISYSMQWLVYQAFDFETHELVHQVKDLGYLLEFLDPTADYGSLWWVLPGYDSDEEPHRWYPGYVPGQVHDVWSEHSSDYFDDFDEFDNFDDLDYTSEPIYQSNEYDTD